MWVISYPIPTPLFAPSHMFPPSLLHPYLYDLSGETIQEISPKKKDFFFSHHVSVWLVELSPAVMNTYTVGWGRGNMWPEAPGRELEIPLPVRWDHAGSTAKGKLCLPCLTGIFQSLKEDEAGTQPGWPEGMMSNRQLAVFCNNCFKIFCGIPQLELFQILLCCGRDSQDESSFNNLLYIAATDLGTYLICDLTAPLKQTVTLSRLVLSITKFSFLLNSAETFPLLL